MSSKWLYTRFSVSTLFKGKQKLVNGSVARFVQNFATLDTFYVSGNFSWRVNWFWAKLEPTFGIFLWNWANFRCCNLTNIEKII